MSTLVTSNISDGTTSVGTGYVVNGSAKAWVNFNGTGTVAIRDSLNVSSLTDNGTGNYSVSFTNAFGAADYAFIFTFAESGNTNVARGGKDNILSSSVVIKVGYYQAGSTNTPTDATYVTASINGDLA